MAEETKPDGGLQLRLAVIQIMTSKTVNVIAIITPPEGQIEKFVEILSNFAAWVKDNEPTTTKYELVRETNHKTGVDNLVMLESYEDDAAFKAHSTTGAFKTFVTRLGEAGFANAKVDMKFVKAAGGFSSRL